MRPDSRTPPGLTCTECQMAAERNFGAAVMRSGARPNTRRAPCDRSGPAQEKYAMKRDRGRPVTCRIPSTNQPLAALQTSCHQARALHFGLRERAIGSVCSWFRTSSTCTNPHNRLCLTKGLTPRQCTDQEIEKVHKSAQRPGFLKHEYDGGG
jgi:hypothetical protein